MNKIKLLVTKKISEEDKVGLGNFDFLEKELISIQLPDRIVLPEDEHNFIFTSKQAILALDHNNLLDKLKGKNVYCVGDKTSQYLNHKGIEVKLWANNATELAAALIEEKITRATYFCGNLRRKELPLLLENSGVDLKEIVVYETSLSPEKFDSAFEGILFFSPSGVRSFVDQNKPEGNAFCLGSTTSCEAIEYFDQVFVAEEPTVKSLINLVKEHFEHG